MMDMLVRRSCSPAEAKKLMGTLGFEFTGYYGKVGRGGQQALIQRQYIDKLPWTLSTSLAHSFRYFLDLQYCPLHRTIPLTSGPLPPIIVASDGRLDDEAPASVAMVMVDVVRQPELAVVGVIRDGLKQRWSC